ncbi:unnamed protein product [Danaus chrysippus]|uniref:(African queen) hypothetical protein n=1 Tax=Danaus chrysippus TaxID=151541 RepID=A0A8J2QPG3_9NEOP|nr:unnamed protein product [Danaus chrysippus]
MPKCQHERTRYSIDLIPSTPLQPNCTFACVHVYPTSIFRAVAAYYAYLLNVQGGVQFRLALEEFRLRPGSGMQHTRKRTSVGGRGDCTELRKVPATTTRQSVIE